MPRCQQNGCRRARATTSTTGDGTLIAGVSSANTANGPNETFVEDVPMCRYVNPIPVCPGEGGDPETEILAALECQNQLLADILGAIQALTAVILSGCSTRES
jgi:hypothetical protein